ncbi:hypothetical protein O181_086523 [Austropuccinia psidii MF-1]|uniref:Uncharacterized protein n=1 Tax=Austropuccinia psidii MF-1 TaxID=1389203 RepID=A0A9Q3FZF0_9BASI|nr:hypothetical protein [Austropuccinia psidii MF-1]
MNCVLFCFLLALVCQAAIAGKVDDLTEVVTKENHAGSIHPKNKSRDKLKIPERFIHQVKSEANIEAQEKKFLASSSFKDLEGFS